MRVLVYDRNDSPLFEITPDELYGLVRDEQLDGPRSLTVTTTHVLHKNERVLVCDATGRWHEYVVEGCDEEHGKGARPIGTYWCSWSMQHDLELTVVSKQPTNASVSTALGNALSGTARWGKGTITATGTHTASMYEMGGWEAVGVLCEVWGCEVDDEITVDTAGVVTRKCAALAHVGSTTATRRFDYGSDMKSITRSTSEEPVYARIIPKGKGEETDTGYYGRRIGIESVNGGVAYLENGTTAPYLKVPDGNGGYEYPTRYVVNDEMETPADLLAWAQANLDEWTVPKVTYSAELSQFQTAGLDANGVALGDDVQVVDKAFYSDGLRIDARVVALRINELDPADMTLTIGDAPANMARGLTALTGSLSDVKATVTAINGGSMTTADYLSRLVDRLNYAINATGGYSYLVPGLGMVTYDVPVVDPANPTEASAVVEVRGGTIRIADSKNPNGTWQYKTVFTSGHIAADVVTAAQITTGYIGSSGGTFIDLDNDVIQLGDQSDVWTEITSDSFDINQGANDGGYLAHFGYGSGVTVGGTDNAPYYTLGTRIANSTIGNWSVAEGIDLISSSYVSHAEGRQTTASNYHAHAEGRWTVASGDGSHAEGSANDQSLKNTASAPGAHAEGYNGSKASGTGSHAEGYGGSKASGEGAHAEGLSTASGDLSHSENDGSMASGYASHAQNLGTIAASSYQTAIGKYNVSDSGNTYALIIGNGTGSNARSNALAVKWDGSVAHGGIHYLKSTNIDRDGSNPSSDTYADSYIVMQDSGGERIGQIRMGQYTNGVMRMRLNVFNEDSNTESYHTFEMTHAKDGSGAYYMGGGHLYLTSSNLDLTASAPSSNLWGDSRLMLRDSNKTTLGEVVPVYNASGNQGMLLYAQRTVNSTAYTTGLYLTIKPDGSPAVGFNGTGSQKAWLDALGFNTWTTVCNSAATTSSWVTNGTGWTFSCTVQYNAAMHRCLVRAQVTAGASKSTGSNTLGTVASAYCPRVRVAIPSLTSTANAMYIETGGSILCNLASAMSSGENIYFAGEYTVA